MDGRRQAYLRLLVAAAIVALIAPVATAQPAGTFSVLHAFAGGTEGANPIGPFLQATDGNLYGVTFSGGGSSACFSPNGCGTLFSMTPDGTVTTLYAFSGGTDGAFPNGRLVQGTDGNLYGITAAGGGSTACGTDPVLGCGTVFKMTIDGAVTVLYAFIGGTDPTSDGQSPSGGLIQATDGNFYGTTLDGGDYGGGTVFRMTPDGAVSVLHAFAGGTDGLHPSGPLLQASDGTLYGVTSFGGGTGCYLGGGCGTVFQMTLDGTVTIVYAFPDDFPGRLERPQPSSLIQATDGNLYGTSTYGGAPNGGYVFQMTSGGTLTVLYTFTKALGGPTGGLLQATDGNFYGTTLAGGGSGVLPTGTVFRMSPDGAVTFLHLFSEADGILPGSVTQACNGNLYGTTSAGGSGYSGGATGNGVVFEFTLEASP